MVGGARNLVHDQGVVPIPHHRDAVGPLVFFLFQTVQSWTPGHGPHLQRKKLRVEVLYCTLERKGWRERERNKDGEKSRVGTQLFQWIGQNTCKKTFGYSTSVCTL